MKKIIIFALILISTQLGLQAQEVIQLNKTIDASIDDSVQEKITFSSQGDITGISDVTSPSMTVYLPDPSIATGIAVVILPGGALRFLSWENEGTKVARWLNAKGIAAFVLKYRLFTSVMQSKSGPQQPMTLRLTVDQFDQVRNANTNLSNNPQMLKVLNMASGDAREAIRIVRQQAGKWNINPAKVGFLGFSAGGGVAINAIVGNDEKAAMPNFVGTIYGPSLVDVLVPQPAPPMFIATNANHMNVAAGCLALFTVWKKAGGNAEIHVYDKGVGPFGMDKKGAPSDTWIDSFYEWLKANEFVTH